MAAPFPSIDTVPMATREELEAEIARATEAESGLVDRAVEAATDAAARDLAAMHASVTSGLEEMREYTQQAVENMQTDAAQRMASMQASVTAAISNANQAAGSAAAITTGFAQEAADAAARDAVRDLFSCGGLATQVADAAAVRVLNTVEPALAVVNDIEVGLSGKADKSYVDACLKQAVVMVQSPNGYSQIQVTDDGDPMLLLSRPWQVVYRDSNDTVRPLRRYGWTPSDEIENYLDGSTRHGILSEDDDGDEDRRVVFLYTYNSALKCVIKSARFSNGRLSYWEDRQPSSFTVRFSNGIYSTTDAGEQITIYESAFQLYYLVKESAIGALEARVAALEAAQT